MGVRARAKGEMLEKRGLPPKEDASCAVGGDGFRSVLNGEAQGKGQTPAQGGVKVLCSVREDIVAASSENSGCGSGPGRKEEVGRIRSRAVVVKSLGSSGTGVGPGCKEEDGNRYAALEESEDDDIKPLVDSEEEAPAGGEKGTEESSEGCFVSSRY